MHVSETHREPDSVAGLIAAIHDGFSPSFLEHGDRDRLRVELQAAVPLMVAVARPRRHGRRSRPTAAPDLGA